MVTVDTLAGAEFEVFDVVVVVVFSFILVNCLPRRTVDRLSAVGF